MSDGARQWIFAARLPWAGVWLNRHYLAREIGRLLCLANDGQGIQ